MNKPEYKYQAVPGYMLVRDRAIIFSHESDKRFPNNSQLTTSQVLCQDSDTGRIETANSVYVPHDLSVYQEHHAK